MPPRNDEIDAPGVDGRSGGLAPGEVQPAPTGLRTAIDVRQDKSTLLMVGFFAGIVAFVIAGLWLGSFAKQQPVRGFISPASGITRLTAPQAGSVAEIFVQQGDRVTQGQRLVRIRSQQIATGKATTLEVELANLNRRRETLTTEISKIAALAKQLNADRALIVRGHGELLANLARQEKELRTAVAQEDAFVAKLRVLVSRRDVTRERLATHERSAREYARQLSELLAKRNEAVREQTQRLGTIDATLNERSNARGSFANELATVETELDRGQASGGYDIVAPAAGEIAALPVETGTSVDAGQIVAALGDPNAEQLVLLDAPASSIGLIRPGQRVVLKYDAFPYKTFGVKGGTVVALSQAPVDTIAPGGMGQITGTAQNTALAKQSMFRLTVRPDSKTIMAYGTERPVAMGSTLTADIVVERRRLIDWVLDPILALRGRT